MKKRVLEANSSNSCKRMWVYLTPLNCTFKKDENGQFYVYFTVIKKRMGEGVPHEMPNKDFRGEKQQECKKVTPRLDKIMWGWHSLQLQWTYTKAKQKGWHSWNRANWCVPKARPRWLWAGLRYYLVGSMHPTGVSLWYKWLIYSPEPS